MERTINKSYVFYISIALFFLLAIVLAKAWSPVEFIDLRNLYSIIKGTQTDMRSISSFYINATNITANYIQINNSGTINPNINLTGQLGNGSSMWKLAYIENIYAKNVRSENINVTGQNQLGNASIWWNRMHLMRGDDTGFWWLTLKGGEGNNPLLALGINQTSGEEIRMATTNITSNSSLNRIIISSYRPDGIATIEFLNSNFSFLNKFNVSNRGDINFSDSQRGISCENLKSRNVNSTEKTDFCSRTTLCSDIVGGSDADYCADATGVGGDGSITPAIWLNGTSKDIIINSSFVGNINMSGDVVPDINNSKQVGNGSLMWLKGWFMNLYSRNLEAENINVTSNLTSEKDLSLTSTSSEIRLSDLRLYRGAGNTWETNNQFYAGGYLRTGGLSASDVNVKLSVLNSTGDFVFNVDNQNELVEVSYDLIPAVNNTGYIGLTRQWLKGWFMNLYARNLESENINVSNMRFGQYINISAVSGQLDATNIQVTNLNVTTLNASNLVLGNATIANVNITNPDFLLNKAFFSDDFFGDSLDARWGTATSVGTVTMVTNNPAFSGGHVNLSSGTGSGSYGAIWMGLLNVFATENPVLQSRFSLDNWGVGSVGVAGFSNTSNGVITTSVGYVMIGGWSAQLGTNYLGICNKRSSISVVNSGIAVDSNPHIFKIEIIGTSLAIFSMDGAVFGTCTSNIPEGGLYPTAYAGMQAGGSGIDKMYVDYIANWQDRK